MHGILRTDSGRYGNMAGIWRQVLRGGLEIKNTTICAIITNIFCLAFAGNFSVAYSNGMLNMHIFFEDTSGNIKSSPPLSYIYTRGGGTVPVNIIYTFCLL